MILLLLRTLTRWRWLSLDDSSGGRRSSGRTRIMRIWSSELSMIETQTVTLTLTLLQLPESIYDQEQTNRAMDGAN